MSESVELQAYNSSDRSEVWNTLQLMLTGEREKELTARAILSHLRTMGDICGMQFWQERFYNHIICNEAELQAIRTYIRNNPLNAGPL